MNRPIIFSIITIATLILLSCQGSQYGGHQGATGANQGAPGFNPNRSGDPNATSNNTGCSHHKWGGVTCVTTQWAHNPPEFLEYISNGTDSKSQTSSIGRISCKPSNNGGILFQMKVVLSGAFDLNGNNNTNLVMQQGSSFLEMVIYDGKPNNIGAKFKGLNGEVNGNKARLVFDYTGDHGRKELTIEGTFDSQVFTGTVHFQNEKRIVTAPKTYTGPAEYTTPGAKGLLGNFRIPTCHVFTST